MIPLLRGLGTDARLLAIATVVLGPAVALAFYEGPEPPPIGRVGILAAAPSTGSAHTPREDASQTFTAPARERAGRPAERLARATDDIWKHHVQPDGEAALYDRFVAEWRAGGETRGRLEADVRERMRAAAGRVEQVALLRALRDVDSPASAEALACALLELPDHGDARGVSLPAFAVATLERSPRVREHELALLRDVARDRRSDTTAATRGRALRVLIERSDRTRLPELRALVESDHDPLVRSIGLEACRTREGSPSQESLRKDPES